MLLDKNKTCLLVIDVQERLVPAMAEQVIFVENCSKLMKTAEILGIPTIVTEQYPKGIGSTIPQLAADMPAGSPMEKNSFPATGEPAILEAIKKTGRTQMVVIGTEAHVCVMQTAIALKDLGYESYVIADASASRKVESHMVSMDRLRQSGVYVATTEMAIFEWLGVAGTPEFKKVSPLIK